MRYHITLSYPDSWGATKKDCVTFIGSTLTRVMETVRIWESLGCVVTLTSTPDPQL